MSPELRKELEIEVRREMRTVMLEEAKYLEQSVHQSLAALKKEAYGRVELFENRQDELQKVVAKLQSELRQRMQTENTGLTQSSDRWFVRRTDTTTLLCSLLQHPLVQRTRPMKCPRQPRHQPPSTEIGLSWKKQSKSAPCRQNSTGRRARWCAFPSLHCESMGFQVNDFFPPLNSLLVDGRVQNQGSQAAATTCTGGQRCRRAREKRS